MRFALLIGAWAVLCSVQAQVGFDHPWMEQPQHLEARAHRGVLKSGGPPSRGYDITYHRFNWQLDPAVRAIGGTVTTHFRSTVATLDSVVFDLSDSLVVSAITRNGQPLDYVHAQDRLAIALPAPLGTGVLDSVTISYAGVPPTTGFGSFGTGEHDGAPVLWTLSEPYGARDWWPAKQDLNDKVDSIDAYVTIPVGNHAAGNGLLVQVDTLFTGQGVYTRHHWRHRHPINYYLIATAVTNYEVLTRDIVLPNDTVLMLTYAYPEDAFLADLNAGDIQQQMPLFGELFGTYPFADEKYGHAQFGWGGGMEHQTMTFLGGYSYELAAHELAHQWFGNKVTCGSWQDLWLNEGFATYLSGLCYDFIATQYWHGWLRAKFNSVTSAPDGSVFVTDTMDEARLFSGRLTYNKGAMVLHMLRWVTGDSAFFAGLRNYLNDPELAFGTALTDDLKAHLEASSGLDLTEFLADWYYGQGYPTYTLMWGQDAAGSVSLQLDQSTSHPSVGFYEMPVPVRFKNAAMDTTVVLDHTFSGQQWSFVLPFQADSVQLDPELWILRGQDLILRVPQYSFNTFAPLLYPNPVGAQATVYVGRSIQGPVTMRITDASGRLLREERGVVADQRLLLTTGTLSPGTYLLELIAGDDQLRMRFVKE